MNGAGELGILFWAIAGKATAELAVFLVIWRRLEGVSDRLARIEGRLSDGLAKRTHD
jgi:hypothetical protein